ncbi:DUF916 domain-containing protein [Streptomyces virginiae]|uniref:DUF916 domain-containing protein n=1 Tax=Streptomyces virginiae TaxID=1961 RepID=UPI002256E101|nr:DUF916 domain-containing protein [Streptomyces virginiae]MCX5276406.1 DUF916 domain-containing protein [Streptomyces virginiae]
MRTAFVVLLLLLLTGLSPTPAGAADNGEWSVRPADSTITPRAAFELPARPGTTLTDRAVVTNTTAAELTFRLYVADAHNTERDGGLAVRGIEETQRDLGAWGKPERDTVTVPARSAVTIGITLAVPRDAPPGDHVGALVAIDTRVRPADGSHLGVQRGVGARIYLRVEGPRQPGLAVEDVRFTARSPQIPWTGTRESTVSYTVHNTGNVKLTPTVSFRTGGVVVGGPGERRLANVPAELLPGQKVRLTETWAGAPFAGWGQVTVTASADDVRGSGTDRFLKAPWLFAACLALLSAAWLLLRRRRRAARGAGAAARG